MLTMEEFDQLRPYDADANFEGASAHLIEKFDAELRQGSVRLISSDSDRTLRALVQEVPDAHDIEVVGVSLDEAFVALTGATGPTPTEEKGATA